MTMTLGGDSLGRHRQLSQKQGVLSKTAEQIIQGSPFLKDLGVGSEGITLKVGHSFRKQIKTRGFFRSTQTL